MKSLRFILLTLLMLWVPCFAGAVETKNVSKPHTNGIYLDSKGLRHPWEVNDAHTLFWDGAPYIPIGGMFCSKYITESQTEDNWAQDKASLDLLKSKGIQDLYINPVGPATSYPADAWQKLLDYLDQQGFRYGIEIADGPTQSLNGYLVRPQSFKVRQNTVFATQFPGASKIAYMIQDSNGENLDSGMLLLDDGSFITRIPQDGKQLSVVTFQKIPVGDQSGLQNYWDGFPDYRDRVLAFFSKLQLGSGFRFFVDPFIDDMGVRAGTRDMIPDSENFRMEYQIYLQKKYPDIEDLNDQWISDSSGLKNHEVAARLVPLQQGPGYALDPKTGQFYSCKARIWKDFTSFETLSVRNYMNLAADILRKKVADVPVIFKRIQDDPIFVNTAISDGFSGLGVEAYGTDDELVQDDAIPAYSQTENSAQTQWLVVTGTEETASDLKGSLGYSSEMRMHSQLDILRKAGAKGFFVFGLQLFPESRWNNFELVKSPVQLEWLANYRDSINKISNFENEKPKTFPYPESAGTSAQIRLLNTGLWWVPSARPGIPLGLPGDLDGYLFKDEMDPPTSVLWVNKGLQKVTLTVPTGRDVKVFLSDGTPIHVKVDKKQQFQLTLSQEPIRVVGIPAENLFPPEAALRALDELQALIQEADSQKIPVFPYKQIYSNAKALYSNTYARVSYDTIRNPIEKLRQLLRQYVWIEGENSAENTFSGVIADSKCSNGGYLKLLNNADSVGSGYTARYNFETKVDGTHEIWFAGSLLDSDVSSPISYSIDGQAPQTVSGKTRLDTKYGKEFYWTKLGTANLSKGTHTLEIRATDRRKGSDKSYTLSIDALVLSPTAFVPNGIQKP